MVRVITWSESSPGPSHRLVHGPSHRMVRVLAWSESSHGPSPCMFRVILCLYYASSGLTQARRPLESSPPPPPRARARARTPSWWPTGPQGSGSRTTGTPPECHTPHPGQVGPKSPPARGRLRADRPNAPPTTKERPKGTAGRDAAHAGT